MKRLVAWLLNKGCEMTGHAGGCGLLNSTGWWFGYDAAKDDARWHIPNPGTHRLWRWALDL